MNVSILICTHGDRHWEERAQAAVKSAEGQMQPREVVQFHMDDGTLAEVRNGAARMATGDWLCFLDGDDTLAVGYLATMRTVMRHWNLARPGDLRENPLLLVPALQQVDTAGDVGLAKIPDWERLLIDLNCGVIGTLVPRRLFLEVGGFHEWPVYEDWDLWLRCVRAGARLVPVPDAVYRARVNPAGRNVKDPAVCSRTYQLIRAAHDDVEPGWWRSCKVQP